MRVILDPILKSTVSNGDGLVIYCAIEAALGDAVRRSATIDKRPYFLNVHADMTVRPFIDPATGTQRWALVIDNDETDVLMRDFPARRHAIRFYEELVRDLADDERALHGGRAHVWDVTDVTGVTANGGYGNGW
jgi:hypothetical protein